MVLSLFSIETQWEPCCQGLILLMSSLIRMHLSTINEEKVLEQHELQSLIILVYLV